jgi:hypothetical protein
MHGCPWGAKRQAALAHASHERLELGGVEGRLVILQLELAVERQVLLDDARPGPERGRRQDGAQGVLRIGVIGEAEPHLRVAGRIVVQPKDLVGCRGRRVALEPVQQHQALSLQDIERALDLVGGAAAGGEQNFTDPAVRDQGQQAGVAHVRAVHLNGVGADRFCKRQAPRSEDIELQMDGGLARTPGEVAPGVIGHFQLLEQGEVLVVRRGELLGIDQLELRRVRPRRRRRFKERHGLLRLAFEALRQLCDDVDVRHGRVRQFPASATG